MIKEPKVSMTILSGEDVRKLSEYTITDTEGRFEAGRWQRGPGLRGMLWFRAYGGPRKGTLVPRPIENWRFRVVRNYTRIVQHRYGLSPERYRQIFTEQGGRCAICNCDPAKKYAHMDKKMHRLHVDHWHDDTTAVRGLLCGNCNWGIGRWLDNPQLLKAAVRYLDKHIPLRFEEAG